MTPADIERMAKEAGVLIDPLLIGRRRAQVLERFAALVRKAALEDAARLCEGERVDAEDTGEETDEAYNMATEHCAAAIRALADKG